MSEVREVTDSTFAEVLGSDVPVLVEFWATWCGPCRMVGPVLAQLAAERAGELVVRKINADENPETTRSYQVMSLPTMILFRGGEPVETIVGAFPKLRIEERLDRVLKAPSL
ncbi:thioredoxin [Amycolatopsis sp. SID8362]|uniref:thioredoxin n=1 Tax=Amycolatopsis sp. SID8362 TaxID=2690346 RepID=UPI00136DD94F|nr:thioredoxin [Amycolatopsis sp. SID8362]NBH11366.1 thioredoxin [Amycolatopsis sp. SID8362]NED48058.1 thioredoxin [Amycolatopsis sp. SID8362]